MTQSEYDVFFEKIARIKELETENAALKAEIKRLKEWHPIADAPKDGTKILGMDRRGGFEVIKYMDYAGQTWWANSSESTAYTKDAFTHFRYIESEVGNG